MGEIIAVVSGKNGTGRSTAAVCLGAALAAREKKVLLIDLNFMREDLTFLFGADHKVVYHLLDVVEGNCKIIQAILRHRDYERLQLIPASSSRPVELIQPSTFVRLMELMKDSFDYILVDAPDSASQGFRCALESADSAILVTTPDRLSVRAAKKMLETSDFSGVRKSILINRFDRKFALLDGALSPEEATIEIGEALLGVIPESEDIRMIATTGELASDKHIQAVKCFDNTAGRLLGEQIPINIKR